MHVNPRPGAKNAVFGSVVMSEWLGPSDVKRKLDTLDEHGKAQILVNVYNMLHHLCNGNHEHRAPAIAALLENVDDTMLLEAMTGLGMGQCQASKNQFVNVYSEADLLTSKAKAAVKRPRGDKQRIAVREHLKQYQVTKSGDKTDIHRTFFSRWDCFKTYQKAGGIAGYTIFQAEWFKMGVKRAAHAPVDYFSCEKCTQSQARVASLEAERDLLMKEIEELPVGETRTARERLLMENRLDYTALKVYNVFFIFFFLNHTSVSHWYLPAAT
jgi:hypothetical protein